MADNVKGITIRTEYLAGLQMLDDARRGQVLLALFADFGCCDMPEMDDVASMVFKLIAPSVHTFQESYARQACARAENGKKGGRPKKLQVSECETEKPTGYSENLQVSEEKPKNLTATTELNLTELNNPPLPPTEKTKRFVPPSVEEVEEYCFEQGYANVDPVVFVDFYEAKNWMIGKNKMKDWKAAVRTWTKKRDELDRRSTWVLPRN